MTIKRKLCKRINDKREFYLDDATEFHSLKEIKDFCYREIENRIRYDSVVYTFTILDTNEDVEVCGNWLPDYEGIHLEMYF